jgi:hypothetical protein
MGLLRYLETTELWESALIVVGSVTALAMIGPIVVRQVVPLDRLRLNNEVAGFKFATVGVIYAVLLGFAVIVVWEKFTSAEHTVTREAGAVVAVYRLSAALSDESAAALRSSLTNYTRTVIERDWPAMEHGAGDKAATDALTEIYAAGVAGGAEHERNPAVSAEIFHQLDVITQARRDRLALAAGIVPDVVWMVLVFGAGVTISFTFFFGATNVLAQTLMTALLALLVSMGLLVILAIDRPFSGAAAVAPEPLEIALHEFASAH